MAVPGLDLGRVKWKVRRHPPRLRRAGAVCSAFVLHRDRGAGAQRVAGRTQQRRCRGRMPVLSVSRADGTPRGLCGPVSAGQSRHAVDIGAAHPELRGHGLHQRHSQWGRRHHPLQAVHGLGDAHEHRRQPPARVCYAACYQDSVAGIAFRTLSAHSRKEGGYVFQHR